MRAVLSLGSNMGDSEALLRAAAQAFSGVGSSGAAAGGAGGAGSSGGVVTFPGSLVSTSSIFTTPPWGVVDQPPFLNAVVIVDTEYSPEELLQFCQSLEQEAHRVRTQHWGPRTLDIDIVDIEGYTSDDPHLRVPHPYAHQRAFVLIPWLQADPSATLAGVALPQLIAALPQEDCAGVVDTGSPLLGGARG